MDSQTVLLKEQEIIEFLRETGIDIRDNRALHKPDSAFVTDVLATVIFLNSSR
jgi:hypothetical protein